MFRNEGLDTRCSLLLECYCFFTQCPELGNICMCDIYTLLYLFPYLVIYLSIKNCDFILIPLIPFQHSGFILSFPFLFKDFIYLFMRDTQRERGRDTGRGKSRLQQEAWCGTQSQESGITPWAKSRRSTAEPPRHLWDRFLEGSLGQWWCEQTVVGRWGSRETDLEAITITQRNSDGSAKRYSSHSEKWSDSVCIWKDSRQAFVVDLAWVVREEKEHEVPQRFDLSTYGIKEPFWSLREWSEVQMQTCQMWNAYQTSQWRYQMGS